LPGAKPVTVEHIKVHSAAIEGNLEGEPADRDVIVFLPPSYETRQEAPLPGGVRAARLLHRCRTVVGRDPRAADHRGRLCAGRAGDDRRLPDSKTVYLGSFYSSSATTGDFERYISHDLVAYIDAHYRTLPTRESRGLVGHSMGGYGASRIGMKHPECLAPSTS
jgi:hypothetical protein